MNMKKKSKKVKKYAVGGDLRGQQPNAMMAAPVFGGGGDDGSATGQVKAISKAAGRAGDYLSTAGRAIGSGGQEGIGGSNPGFPGVTDTFRPGTGGGFPQSITEDFQPGDGDLKKGGKVKRYAKGDMVESKKAAVEKRKRAISAGIPDQATSDSISEFDEKGLPKKKKPGKKKNMGGMIKYKTGGTITQPRGVGRAVQRKIRSATLT